MTPEEIKSFMETEEKIRVLIEERINDRLEASELGFGRESNEIDYIKYSTNLIWVHIKSKESYHGFDSCISMKELMMSDEEWKKVCDDIRK